MKLTLQLVVVVLNAPTKFRDNLFKLTLCTIIIYKVGDTRCHLAGPDQRAAKKMRPGHSTKNIHPWRPGRPFWGPIHHLPKAILPCWKKYLIEGNCSS